MRVQITARFQIEDGCVRKSTCQPFLLPKQKPVPFSIIEISRIRRRERIQRFHLSDTKLNLNREYLASILIYKSKQLRLF